MRRERKIVGVFLSVIFLFFIISCNKTSDEDQIKLVIDKLSQAIEANKPADIAEYLHEDFRANGDMSVQQVKQLLVMQGLQHRAISITILGSKTIIDSVYTDRAESTLSVVTTASSGSLVPNDGSVRVVRLQWQKDGDWKILKADWQQ
jgi:type III secretory pathway lipoprotein EscJ